MDQRDPSAYLADSDEFDDCFHVGLDHPDELDKFAVNDVNPEFWDQPPRPPTPFRPHFQYENFEEAGHIDAVFNYRPLTPPFERKFFFKREEKKVKSITNILF